MKIATHHFQIPRIFAISGLLCFITSLALPSIRLILTSTPDDFYGAQAAIWSVVLGVGKFSEFSFDNGFEAAKCATLTLAGVWNLAQVITPMLLIWRAPSRSLCLYLGAASLIGLTLGILSPLTVPESKPKVLIGYFFWLLGFALQCLAALYASKQLRKQ